MDGQQTMTNRWMLFLMGLLLSACSSENKDLIQYVNGVKARPPKPVEPIPELHPIEQYIFPENDQRRNPFNPVVQEQDNSLAPNTQRPKQPLEYYPLDALKFVGILKQDSIVWGLISQPNGLIIRVHIGDYMGQNYGRILSINEKAIEIEETIRDNGVWKKKKELMNIWVPQENKK